MWKRFKAWLNTPLFKFDRDEYERLTAGMSYYEYYNKVQKPRSMREHGCKTEAEYDELLNTWRRKFHREWKEDQKRRDLRARALWPKDRPYRP